MTCISNKTNKTFVHEGGDHNDLVIGIIIHQVFIILSLYERMKDHNMYSERDRENSDKPVVRHSYDGL